MLFKYSGKYVNIYFNMKITFFIPLLISVAPGFQLSCGKSVMHRYIEFFRRVSVGSIGSDCNPIRTVI